MNAADHIAEAKTLLDIDWGGSPDHIANRIAEAQVHATLALAEATIAGNRLRSGPSSARGFG